MLLFQDSDIDRAAELTHKCLVRALTHTRQAVRTPNQIRSPAATDIIIAALEQLNGLRRPQNSFKRPAVSFPTL